MILTSSIFASSLLASVACAHFTLDYPPTRGFDEDKEPTFCGGFDTVSAQRQPAPLNGAAIWIDSHHPLATVDAFLSTQSDPKTWDDFNSTINGTSSVMMASNFFQVASGVSCWNIDFSALPYNLTNGSQITLQIQYNGGDSPLYQCTDLVLLSDYTVPSNYTCSKDAAAEFTKTRSSGPSVTSQTGAASSPASTVRPNGASRAAASGGLFAMAVAALAIAL
ncbi:hypothetical protein CcaverHIS002_0103880 [Cutaneotrichosporon cavernicola]|uniref:Copper acquisition factor BIM1-like domain-containing protein n=1 Tax=Cutaneotrichosporon cavernicola TaxID=279322 RepID=A0AA48IHV8_9TREE|nr:uncharacterized protein CcaverHIS019_0103810 [Cutaneotrichosporon cavernicola]BEI79859.1 hypothetical protein CcaverHIS002_0103880 [Cutaneotrichosporon cavernicola]BEI87663.1 hypothetical protein CcaverHIS019_0103810 [Cutaneotrichosporon cavernicola]BEI95435.1 hypothetical protein CcaverHIS631_0103840 [Cutaneotrichosporon cavernicola]BEJ03209.1 hypothetical protein CcaverHIS641_0103840 [Cutaneotrichosporon cavernicola]